MKLLKTIFYYLLGVIGIIAISVAPHVIQTRGVYNPFAYVSEFFKFFGEFFDPSSWVYIYKSKAYPILDYLWDPFVYTMQIVVGALLIGFIIALILALLANFLPKFILESIKKILNFLESIPDLMIALFMQLLVVFIFKKTGVLIFGIAAFGSDDKIFWAPVITLAILPIISFFKIMLLLIEEELVKDYVEFARSKGIKWSGILLVHVLKNVAFSTFHHSKIILWGILSSLFVIEYVFNVRGISAAIIEDFRPITIAVSLLLVYTPFFFIYQFINLLISAETRHGKAIAKKEKINWKAWKIWSVLKGIGKTVITHLKNPKIAIGTAFIVGLTAYSIIYTITAEEPIKYQKFLINDQGTIVGGPPHPPGDPFILGADVYGYSILDQLIVGAKYTLIFAFLIALLRIFFGFLFGTIFAFKISEEKQKWFEKIADSIHFLPLSVIAYLLLRPILTQGSQDIWAYTFGERIFLEVVILTILVVPLTSVLIGNEMKQIIRKEFITSAEVLGGSTRHILKKHIMPHIGPRMTIIFGQQFIQVLLIFIHLGVYNLFFGGSEHQSSFEFQAPPRTTTFEWSGLIGSTREALLTGQYFLIGWVLLAFMLTIFAMQLIIQGVKEVQQIKVGVVYNWKKILRRRKRQEKVQPANVQLTDESFKFLAKNQENDITS